MRLRLSLRLFSYGRACAAYQARLNGGIDISANMDLPHTLLWLVGRVLWMVNEWFPWHGLFLKVSGITAPLLENLKPSLVLALPQDGSCFSKVYRSKILSAAEKVLSHEFDLLGSGPMRLGDSIDWSRDFKSGKTWLLDYYAVVRTVRLDGSDVKVPWELNRFQHLTILGEAYVFSGDDKYYAEFKNEVEDWFVKNPFVLASTGPARWMWLSGL